MMTTPASEATTPCTTPMAKIEPHQLETAGALRVRPFVRWWDTVPEIVPTRPRKPPLDPTPSHHWIGSFLLEFKDFQA
jgi:hypothetical protein